ncbi:MAG: MBL fold metallo-hydrolase [Planctomycetota bacterium]|nr:MBL fold metallo-hydrolase [Planctomycetota bacterium]
MKVFLFSTGAIEAPGPVMRQMTNYFFPMMCVLIDHPSQGLSLVDCGFGTNQLVRGDRNPERLLAPFVSIKLHASQIAAKQIQSLDYDPQDVQRIILTHMHWDHCDGLADFPNAEVVVHPKEKKHACRFLPPLGYEPFQFFDVKKWQEVKFRRQNCLGFSRSLDLFGDGSVKLVDLPGHSAGHQGVFLPSEKIFLTGDAFLEEDELHRRRPRPYQLMNTYNHWANWRTLSCLRKLHKHSPDIAMLGSHSFCPPGGWPNHPVHWQPLARSYSI